MPCGSVLGVTGIRVCPSRPITDGLPTKKVPLSLFPLLDNLFDPIPAHTCGTQKDVTKTLEDTTVLNCPPKMSLRSKPSKTTYAILILKYIVRVLLVMKVHTAELDPDHG